MPLLVVLTRFPCRIWPMHLLMFVYSNKSSRMCCIIFLQYLLLPFAVFQEPTDYTCFQSHYGPNISTWSAKSKQNPKWLHQVWRPLCVIQLLTSHNVNSLAWTQAIHLFSLPHRLKNEENRNPRDPRPSKNQSVPQFLKKDVENKKPGSTGNGQKTPVKPGSSRLPVLAKSLNLQISKEFAQSHTSWEDKPLAVSVSCPSAY